MTHNVIRGRWLNAEAPDALSNDFTRSVPTVDRPVNLSNSVQGGGDTCMVIFDMRLSNDEIRNVMTFWKKNRMFLLI